LKAVLRTAIDQAKDGDATARAWLFDRVFGRVVASDVLMAREEIRQEFDELKEALLNVLSESSPTLRDQVLTRVRQQTETQRT
jgi:hypothetical protein